MVPRWSTSKRIASAILFLCVACTTACQASPPVSNKVQEYYDSIPSRAAQAEADELAKKQAAYDAASVDVPTPSDGTVDYLLAGDSLSNGAAATSPERSFREVIGSKLSAGTPVEIVLAGKAGQGVDLIAPQALEAGDDFDVIVVEVGTNDVTTSAPTAAEAEAFSNSYRTFVAGLRVKSPRAALVCLGPWRDAKVGAEFEAAIATVCEEQGGKYRPLSQHYGVAENRWRDGVMPDGTPVDNFHPSDLGHADIASEVLGALRLDGARPTA